VTNALVSVLRGEVPERRPIWFMRQAGRYLPEYRMVRERAGSFLDLCYNPEMSCEVTVQPLRRFDLDAAILFADILVVPNAMGLPLKFEEGEGPVIGTVRCTEDVAKLRPISESWEVQQVCGTVRLTRERLGKNQALIGFCGGPWTVASYLIAGGSSDRVLGKVAAYRREEWFVSLIKKLVVESIEYLCAQIRAGVDAVQIFDSWAGDLVGKELGEFVVNPVVEIARGVKAAHPDVGVIAFARGIGAKHGLLASSRWVDAVGIETELDMSELQVGGAVQGNLDPVALLAGREVAVREALRVCGNAPGGRHIFNLGHGIRVGTEPDVVGAVVDAVRRADG